MTENKPPAEAQASATSVADQPGRPYYEQLRTTLRGTLDKKRKLDDRLAALEDQIFKLEGAYLEETSNSGNIVRGFDGWVKGVSVGGRGADDRRRGRVRDEDRVFSHSSVGWMKVGNFSDPWMIALDEARPYADSLNAGARRSRLDDNITCGNAYRFSARFVVACRKYFWRYRKDRKQKEEGHRQGRR